VPEVPGLADVKAASEYFKKSGPIRTTKSSLFSVIEESAKNNPEHIQDDSLECKEIPGFKIVGGTAKELRKHGEQFICDYSSGERELVRYSYPVDGHIIQVALVPIKKHGYLAISRATGERNIYFSVRLPGKRIVWSWGEYVRRRDKNTVKGDKTLFLVAGRKFVVKSVHLSEGLEYVKETSFLDTPDELRGTIFDSNYEDSYPFGSTSYRFGDDRVLGHRLKTYPIVKAPNDDDASGPGQDIPSDPN
jgi:hypothetical protein